MKRIVLSTIGSYGDLNPYIAIGRALAGLGSEVCIAGPEFFRQDVLRNGLDFHPVRPHVHPDDTDIIFKAMNRWSGAEYLTRTLMMPALPQSYRDLYDACARADCLVSHVLTLAGPVAAQMRGIPWVTALLQPMVMFSAHDMPIVPPLTALKHVRVMGPGANRWILRVLAGVSARWGRPLNELRRELGLAALTSPLLDGYRSPFGNLAMFPAAFASRQPDWPMNTEICGFPFLDEDLGGKGLSESTASFLERGSAPLVFTLGTAAVRVARGFVETASRVARALGQRAVIVAGSHAGPPPAFDRCDDVLVVDSIPYFQVFPRASVVIHSGGIGTTAQALRAGVPQVLVPFNHDQFDNADRVARLGVGVDTGKRLSGGRWLVRHVHAALTQPSYASAADAVSRKVALDGALPAARHVLRTCGVA